MLHVLPRTESFVKSLPGIKSASVNYADTSIRVEFSPEEISPSEMKKAVQSIGYDIIIDEANSQEMKEEARNTYFKKIRINTIGAASFSIPLVIIAMVFMNIPYANYIMMALATPVVFWFGRQFPVRCLEAAETSVHPIWIHLLPSAQVLHISTALSVTFFPGLAS